MQDDTSSPVLAVVTRWLGFISGVFTMSLWCFLLPTTKASISIPHNFLDDVNRETWRLQLFSFSPDVFIDMWTPFVMGLAAVLCHFENFNLSFITQDFMRFFLWNFILALFGNLGYAGGMGVVVGCVTLLTTFFSLICIFVCNGSAKLDIRFGKRSDSMSF
ncbi:hypothetical protein BESB_083090 [Besnoitia besnoiti]|uniref:Transmembrane protein n=1 Tax=Besnoitia besnoiti TaxID=94643 RepID=A0A2A9MCI9_BESBE|nr:hypothetical protein BESB_083090 [Besnoitia besnoiti]PFH33110.1 hypothetical protein BESB_083090 [Besnoitia besnoiti]